MWSLAGEWESAEVRGGLVDSWSACMVVDGVGGIGRGGGSGGGDHGGGGVVAVVEW